MIPWDWVVVYAGTAKHVMCIDAEMTVIGWVECMNAGA